MKEWQSKYILLLITLIFVFSSCSNGLTDMFDSYNGNFTSADLVKTDNPGAPGFDASMMLPPCYAVRDDEKLNLAAPPGCDTYSWAIFSRDETLISKTDDSSTFNQRVALRNVSDDTQYFKMVVSEQNNLKTGVTYKLVLTCTLTVNGEKLTYTDTCDIVIYTSTML